MQYNQRGTAIIVALFITALVSAIAVAMIMRVRMDTRRTELLLNQIQADLYADGALSWARKILTDNLKKQKQGTVVDSLPVIRTDTENGVTIHSNLEDAESLLNLNSLTKPVFLSIFLRLIKQSHNITEQQLDDIKLGIIDWISPGLQNSPFDQYYAKLKPPYRSPHYPMASVSELRLVKGVSPALFNKLISYIITLPEKRTININTAPLQVITALSNKMTTEKAKALITARNKTPFTSTQALYQFPVVKTAEIPQNVLGVISNYFLLKTTVKLSNQQETIITLLHREAGQDGKVTTGVVWQSKGTL